MTWSSSATVSPCDNEAVKGDGVFIVIAADFSSVLVPEQSDFNVLLDLKVLQSIGRAR